MISIPHSGTSLSTRPDYHKQPVQPQPAKTGSQAQVQAQVVSTSITSFNYSSSVFNGVLPTTGVEKYQAIGGQKTPAAYAATILNFIENRLAADQQDGATRDQLQTRLEAGAEGFLKGYQEAKAQLEAANLLTPEVEQAISSTYKNVISGVNKLAEKWGLESPVADLVEPASEAEPPSSSKRPTKPQQTNLFADYYADNAFSFRLKTQDGDVVTIRAQASQAGSFGLSTGYFGDNQYQSFNLSLSNSNDFMLSVEGELDADELRAINDLLGQVNEVSNTFFSGDIYGAFEQALKVGFDSDEIARFALNLKRTEYTRIDSSYNRIADYGNNHGPARQPNQPITEIADFIQQLEAARQKAEKIGMELLTLTGLADHVGKNRFGQHDKQPHFTPLVRDMLHSLEGMRPQQKSQ